MIGVQGTVRPRGLGYLILAAVTKAPETAAHHFNEGTEFLFAETGAVELSGEKGVKCLAARAAMQINMTFIAADEAARRVPTKSPPLSKISSGNRVNDLRWWGDQPKQEDFSSDRHRGTLGLYQHLASHAPPGLLPPRCFPALFEFSDGQLRRPDKGWIKAAVGNGIIVGVDGVELLFEIVVG